MVLFKLHSHIPSAPAVFGLHVAYIPLINNVDLYCLFIVFVFFNVLSKTTNGSILQSDVSF